MTALTHYDNNDFDESLGAFGSIADTSKILFNCGVIHATLGNHAHAVSNPRSLHQHSAHVPYRYIATNEPCILICTSP